MACAAFYVAFLFVAAVLLDGHPPVADLSGAWFTAGAIALILGVLLAEPFHTRPVDALLTGAFLFLTAWSVSTNGAAVPADEVALGRSLAELYGLGLLGLSALAILLKDQAGLAGHVAHAFAWTVARAGRAIYVFSAIYLIAVYAAFATRPDRMLAGVMVWSLIVGVRPCEGLLRLRRRQRTSAGTIRSLEDPGSVVLQVDSDSTPEVGTVVGLGDHATGTVVDRTQLRQDALVRIALDGAAPLRLGQSLRLSERDARADVIGYVGPGTSAEEIRIRTAAASARDVALRRLVFPATNGDPIFYMTSGATLFEDREQDVLEERVEIVARKVGRWNAELASFVADSWLPDPGTPVRLHRLSASATLNTDWLGNVPDTEFGVPISISEAVTHNTAILGILGSGKTTLAWQLIRRMLVDGIHVVVLDISRRYGPVFRDVFPEEAGELVVRHLQRRAAAAKTEAERGRVVPDLLEKFIAGDKQLLLILDPADFVAELPRNYRTASEFTRAVADALLMIAKAANPNADPDAARYCLVLEEAHSLVPEWTSKVDDEERGAVNATQRALLQGRKYGLGSVIITQRTANVAKSILNQCNTVFAMCMYDDTGIDFLRNYVGSRYAELLPTLRRGEAIAFGTAIRRPKTSPETPIPLLVRVHDDKKFRKAFWDPRLESIPRWAPSEEPAEPSAVGDGPEAAAERPPQELGGAGATGGD